MNRARRDLVLQAPASLRRASRHLRAALAGAAQSNRGLGGAAHPHRRATTYRSSASIAWTTRRCSISSPISPRPILIPDAAVGWHAGATADPLPSRRGSRTPRRGSGRGITETARVTIKTAPARRRAAACREQIAPSENRSGSMIAGLWSISVRPAHLLQVLDHARIRGVAEECRQVRHQPIERRKPFGSRRCPRRRGDQRRARSADRSRGAARCVRTPTTAMRMQAIKLAMRIHVERSRADDNGVAARDPQTLDFNRCRPPPISRKRRGPGFGERSVKPRSTASPSACIGSATSGCSVGAVAAVKRNSASITGWLRGEPAITRPWNSDVFGHKQQLPGVSCRAGTAGPVERGRSSTNDTLSGSGGSPRTPPAPSTNRQ